MDLLIIRHAIAAARNRRRWRDDSERPLTQAGARRARRAAAGLKRIVERPDRVFTSPLRRAAQTAAILTEIADWPKAIDCPELTPGESPQAILGVIRGCRGKLIAIVGHQPELGRFIAACLGGAMDARAFELKKNAVACLSFPGTPGPGQASLKWLAAPSLLRAMR
jgi:phosphohistidine phosphatase SixA